MIYNNTQCSGYIDLRNVQLISNTKYSWYDVQRATRSYDNFNYNDFVDNVVYDNTPFLDSNLEPILSKFTNKSWYEKSNFINNYFILRFTYNGTNRLQITNINPTFIKTQR